MTKASQEECQPVYSGILQVWWGSRILWPCTGCRGGCQGVVRMGAAPGHSAGGSVMLPCMARRVVCARVPAIRAPLPWACNCSDAVRARARNTMGNVGPTIHLLPCLRDTQQTATTSSKLSATAIMNPAIEISSIPRAVGRKDGQARRRSSQRGWPADEQDRYGIRRASARRASLLRSTRGAARSEAASPLNVVARPRTSIK